LLLREVRKLDPGAGVNLPYEACRRWNGRGPGVVPFGHGHYALRSPVLLPAFALDMKQNPEAARAILAVEFGALRIGKAMMHLPAMSNGSVAEEPCVPCPLVRPLP